MQAMSVETSKHTAATAKQRSAPLEPQVADRLLDLLSTDDMFRRLFKSNPAKALAQVGFVEPTSAPSPFGCFFGISKLATSGPSQTTPSLDAANHPERRTLK